MYLRLLLLYLLTIIVFNTNAQTLDTITVVLTNNSELIIKGSTNLNNFKCRISQEFEQDTLIVITHYENKRLKLNNAKVAFKTEGFNCGQPGINKDFRETLKYKTHPLIILRIKEIGLNNMATAKLPTQVSVLAEIELAGKIQDYTIEIEEVAFKEGIMSFTGSQTVLMTDFEIIPPRVLLGLIKVNDQLTINFDFNLHVIKK